MLTTQTDGSSPIRAVYSTIGGDEIRIVLEQAVLLSEVPLFSRALSQSRLVRDCSLGSGKNSRQFHVICRKFGVATDEFF
jgi:hypothetical protein